MEWISVKEKLPEDCKNVIVPGGIGYYSYACNSWFTITNCDVPKIIHWKVTHWMDLPKPQDDHNGFHGKEIGILRFNPEINDLQIVAAPKLINDGDSVPLPDNIIAEKIYIEPDNSIHCNRGVDRYRLKLKEPLVDTGSKETQEQIFDDMFCKYFDYVYVQKLSGYEACDKIQKHFTITRK